MGLLLPAVQAAREAARRMSCGNNVKQIGLALHNYHDTHGKFPPGVIWGPGPLSQVPYTQPYHHTWMVMILPFMEQQPLYDSVDMRLPIWGQPIVGTKLANLRCPSDGGRWETDDTHGIAVTNYAGSEGYHWWPAATVGNWNPWNTFGDPFIKTCDISGVFTQTKTRRMSDITDGLSNTLAFAEADSMGYGGGPIRTSGSGARRTGTPVFRSAFVGTGVAGWGGNEGGVRVVNPDGSSKAGTGWFKNHAFPPTFISAWGPNANWPGPSSYHPAGIQIGVGDGSVSFIAESIDYGTWAKLNGIADSHTMIDPR